VWCVVSAGYGYIGFFRFQVLLLFKFKSENVLYK